MEMDSPMKMSEGDVRLFALEMMYKVPPELTLADTLDVMFGTISAISDRITMEETGSLLGIVAVVAKVVAAKEQFTSTAIKIEKGTRQ